MNGARARRLPAEWEPQAGVLLTWPHDDSDWASRLSQVEPVFADLAYRISRFEPLWVVCRDAGHRAAVRERLVAAGVGPAPVHLYQVPSDDAWARDHGPIGILQDDVPCLIDFRFNGWGGKYPSTRDDAVSARLHAAGAFGDTPLLRSDLVLEGGSIDSDGRGTLLTTARCLLSPGRNPHLDRGGIEAALGDALGVTRVLWLEHGALAGDDTDSHVDTLARFCDPTTIAYQACVDPADEHFGELSAMAEELAALRIHGRGYRCVPLPLPAPVHASDGQRLPAGYANFLVINGAVLVPAYDDPADAVARRRLAGCFPGREVISVPCRPLLLQFGSLHCVTMQIPAGVAPAA